MKQKQINNIIAVHTLAMSEGNSRILEISIPTHKKLNNITHYEVLCITNLQEYKKCYSRVFRRYKQFRHLYKVLSGKIVQPEFPKKRFFNYKEEVIKERIAMFSVWLRYIAKLVDDNNCYGDEWAKEVLRFLQDDKYPGYN